jgi:hypothetical protein
MKLYFENHFTKTCNELLNKFSVINSCKILDSKFSSLAKTTSKFQASVHKLNTISGSFAVTYTSGQPIVKTPTNPLYDFNSIIPSSNALNTQNHNKSLFSELYTKNIEMLSRQIISKESIPNLNSEHFFAGYSFSHEISHCLETELFNLNSNLKNQLDEIIVDFDDRFSNYTTEDFTDNQVITYDLVPISEQISYEDFYTELVELKSLYRKTTNIISYIIDTFRFCHRNLFIFFKFVEILFSNIITLTTFKNFAKPKGNAYPPCFQDENQKLTRILQLVTRKNNEKKENY